MRVAIAIDDWKQPIFEKILDEHGYVIEVGTGVTPNSRMIYVETTDPLTLKDVLVRCQRQAAQLKG